MTQCALLRPQRRTPTLTPQHRGGVTLRRQRQVPRHLKKNKSLRSLNLESNNLTASGHDQKGIIELANSLKDNQCLRVLMLSKNAVAHEAAALGADRYR